MNSLKEKAKNIQTKTQEGFVDGEIKLKEEQQKTLGTFEENADEEEEDEDDKKSAQKSKKAEISKKQSSNASTPIQTKSKADDKKSPALVLSEKLSPNNMSQKPQNDVPTQGIFYSIFYRF